MKYYLLFDYPFDKNEFISKKSSFPLEKVGPSTGKKGGKLKCWLSGVYNVIKRSNRGDVIVCNFDFLAVLLYWFCLLAFKKREIFAINIMLKSRPTLKNWVVTQMYKVALKSKHFHASVTSTKYGEWLNQTKGMNVKYSVIRDVCRKGYLQFTKGKCATSNTIFCGGKNGRDWGFMVELAKTLPQFTFTIVTNDSVYRKIKGDVPSNVKLYHSIPLNTFMDLLLSSEVVCLPLDTEAPAGLIVVFETATCKKPLFITETVTSCEYVNETTGYPLPRDVYEWKRALEYGFAHRGEMQAKAEKMFDFITKECSEDNFVKQLDIMIGNFVK